MADDAATRVLYEAPADSGEFTVLKAGSFVKGGRTIPVTEADLDKAVSNFERAKAVGAAIPVDYDHSFASGKGSRAAGWFESMRRDGAAIVGKVSWTPPAREALERDEFRYFSPEFTPAHRNESGEDEGFTILAGGLTNRPFLRGATRVAFSAEGDDPAGLFDAMAEELRTAQGFAEALDENPGAMDEPQTFEVEIDGEARTFSQDDIVALVDKAEKGAAALAQNEALTAQVEQVASDLADERFSTCFSQALREGRIDAKPETREKWEGRFKGLGYGVAKDLLFEHPAETIPVGERGSSTDKAGKQPVGEAPDGVEPEAFAVDNRAKELMAEDKDLGYSDAVMTATRELAEEIG